MSRRPPKNSLEPGQDSFLDVVANLVGILIILIAVIGVQTKQALIDRPREPDDESVEDRVTEIEQRNAAAQQALASHEIAEYGIEKDIADKLDALKRHELEIQYREAERQRLQVLLSAVSRQMDERKTKMSAAGRRHLELNRELALTQQQLGQLNRALQDAQQSQNKPVVLRHLPTPMAKTVFGKEIHFRLERGRIAYVPFDEMVEMLKDEAQRQAWKLKDAPAIEEQLGPVQGFRMNYRLVRREVSMPSQFGVVTQSGIGLDRFHLHPISDDLGDPVGVALRDGSQMRDVLAANRPQTTTITIWVYPDSFQFFHDLKDALYEMGYLTAARPMPPGQPIGGSPQGTRSAAQ